MSDRGSSRFTTSLSRAEHARFVRRQEALTIAWIRALARSSTASTTTSDDVRDARDDDSSPG